MPNDFPSYILSPFHSPEILAESTPSGLILEGINGQNAVAGGHCLVVASRRSVERASPDTWPEPFDETRKSMRRAIC